MAGKEKSNTAMRRADRAVEDQAWIKQFLAARAVGILALADGEQPFINSNLYAYDEAANAIYIHTARLGRTRDIVEKNPRACLHVFEMGRLLPADEALEFSIEYAGVTVFGDMEILEDAAEQESALQLILDKYAPQLRPGKDYRPITSEEIKGSAVFKLAIREWSAKKKLEAPDFPDAFQIPEISFLK